MVDDLYWRFHRSARISDRSVDELIGLCRGLLADGSIIQSEAEFLLNWMKVNQVNCMQWPMNMLFGRVSAMLEDGMLDSSERTELFDLLTKFTGGLLPEEAADSGLVVSGSTALPLDDPQPSVTFDGRTFCFTGEMCFGPRRNCEQLVLELGGLVRSTINKGLDYLVIGTIGSMSWAHSTHGRKIESAVSLRHQGFPLALIDEQHWLKEVESHKTGRT